MPLEPAPGSDKDPLDGRPCVLEMIRAFTALAALGPLSQEEHSAVLECVVRPTSAQHGQEHILPHRKHGWQH